ncbi:hypothetical protein [Sporosarcina sp. FSL K6-2383]|uniref:hypothetical protein n=1 Tax=Sporosarcina sp. FSL K6-2383 TaxID=2921556 RepID=UPI00315A57F2
MLFQTSLNKLVNIDLNRLPFFRKSTICMEIIIYQDNKCSKFLFIESLSKKEMLLMSHCLKNDEITPVNINEIKGVYEYLLSIITKLDEEDKEKFSDICQLLNSIMDDIPPLDNGNKIINNGPLYILVSKDINNTEKYSFDLEFIKGEFIQPVKFHSFNYRNNDVEGTIEISEENLHLSKMRLLQEFKIYINDSFQKNHISTNILLEMKKNNSNYIFKYSSAMYYLKTAIQPFMESRIREPLELLNFILAKSSIDYSIEDFKGRNRTFQCIVPLNNLKVANSVGLGNVEIVNKSYITGIDDLMMHVEKQNVIFDSYAKVLVEGLNFWEATNLAINQIEKAIDSIYHLKNHDSLFFDKQVENLSWNRKNYGPVVSSDELIFIQDIVSNEFMITSLDLIRQPTFLDLDNRFEILLEKLEWYEKLLIMDMEEESKSNVKTLFIALRYLRKSWDIPNLEDKLIFTSIALEFLLEDEKPQELLARTFRRRFVNEAMKQFKEIYLEADAEPKAIKVKQIIAGSLSNPPLMENLRHLVARLLIPLTEVDIEYIETIRSQRNDLVHGRSIPDIDLKKIEYVNTIIGILLFFKMQERAE